MRALAMMLTWLALPGLVPAQTQDGSTNDVHREAETQPPVPVVSCFPGDGLDVAFAERVPGLTAGARVGPNGPIDVPDGGCLRLVASDRAAVMIGGPARGRVAQVPAGEGVRVIIEAGRGLLWADDPGVLLTVGGKALVVSSGEAAFDTDAGRVVWLLSGQGSLDGAELEPVSEEPATVLQQLPRCAPPRPSLSVRLGEPSAVVAAAAERRRRTEQENDTGSSSAEGAATCVDSADTSSASDPTQGGESSVDPDARRDSGRLRIVLEVPRRSR